MRAGVRIIACRRSDFCSEGYRFFFFNRLNAPTGHRLNGGDFRLTPAGRINGLFLKGFSGGGRTASLPGGSRLNVRPSSQWRFCRSLRYIYLSKKTRWERRSLELFRDELYLEGKRWEHRRIRYSKLKEFVKQLDGVELCHGRLKVWIERTKDDEDYKPIAVKVPRTAPKKRAALTPVSEKEEAESLAEELLKAIRRLPQGAAIRDRSSTTYVACTPYRSFTPRSRRPKPTIKARWKRVSRTSSSTNSGAWCAKPTD